MATVFKRLCLYAEGKKRLPILTLEQKIELGEKVASTYFQIPLEKRPAVHKVPTKEPEGEFMVLSYHRSFSRQIDILIHQYYCSLKPRPKEKIKYIPKPLNRR
jgi:hypothetical protein